MSDPLRQKVKFEREQRGLSIREVCKGLEISDTAWANYESGKVKRLTGNMRRSIATAFGWPINWTADEPTTETAPPAVDEVAELRGRVEELEQVVRRLGARVVKTDTKARQPKPKPPRRRRANPDNEA